MKILLFLILGLALGVATKLEYAIIICVGTGFGALYLYTSYYYFQNHKTALNITSIALSLFLIGYIYCVGRGFYQEHNQIHNMPHDIKVIGYITDLPHYKNSLSYVVFKVTEGYYANKKFMIFYDDPKDRKMKWGFNQYYQLNLHLSFPPLHNEANSPPTDNFKIDGYAKLLTAPITLKSFWSVLGGINNLRQNMMNYLQVVMFDNEFKGVIISLVTGCNDYITEEQWKLFHAVGIIHLVNISGLHVTIIYGWLVLIARYIYNYTVLQLWKIQNRKSQPLINQVDFISYFSVFTICVYGLFVGMSVPTQRAVFCVVFLNIFSLCRVYISKIDVLILVCTLVLLWDPGHLFDGGCWISFAIIFVIFYISTQYRYRSTVYRKLLYIVMMSGVVFPLSVWFFGSIAWASLLVNTAAIPVIGDIITPFLLFASICHIDSVVEFAGWCLQICLHVLSSLGFLQEAAVYCDDIAVIILSYCGFLLLVIPRIVKFQLILGVMLMSSIFFYDPLSNKKDLWFLVVPDKHEIIFMIINQNHGYLIYFSDGNYRTDKSQLISLLTKYKIDQLDFIYSNLNNIKLFSDVFKLNINVVDHQLCNKQIYNLGQYQIEVKREDSHLLLIVKNNFKVLFAVTDGYSLNNANPIFNNKVDQLFYISLDKSCVMPQWGFASYFHNIHFFYFVTNAVCWNQALDNLNLYEEQLLDGIAIGAYIKKIGEHEAPQVLN